MFVWRRQKLTNSVDADMLNGGRALGWLNWSRVSSALCATRAAHTHTRRRDKLTLGRAVWIMCSSLMQRLYIIKINNPTAQRGGSSFAFDSNQGLLETRTQSASSPVHYTHSRLPPTPPACLLVSPPPAMPLSDMMRFRFNYCHTNRNTVHVLLLLLPALQNLLVDIIICRILGVSIRKFILTPIRTIC